MELITGLEPDLFLTKEVLYRLSYMSLITFVFLERVAGIEPASSAWKAEVLPLNYTRALNTEVGANVFTPIPKISFLRSAFCSVSPVGGWGWIRTTEAYASDLQSDPFGHSGTPPKKRR